MRTKSIEDAEMVSFRIPAHSVRTADAIAVATQSNRSQVVRQALSIGLRELMSLHGIETAHQPPKLGE